MSQKLDPSTQTKWEESAACSNIPTWESMETFLEKRCQTLESINFATVQNTPSAKQCKSSNCRRCLSQHHTLLHFIPAQQSTTDCTPDEKPESAAQAVTSRFANQVDLKMSKFSYSVSGIGESDLKISHCANITFKSMHNDYSTSYSCGYSHLY
ncbi:PREDICTED: uncharacterized protein LOC108367726 isoform X1 [Rhagoletis zephyria]|uniref:uncharacterized protein LOC108367726 isoform X1 n=1 Tax=Rhagoletis zephyria TaxID=28612 RepID=UPI0008118772|nr:PREDICTED: uncharacterized protein LOC108367726 isoform X1 [Rhagoletis zephyria]